MALPNPCPTVGFYGAKLKLNIGANRRPNLGHLGLSVRRVRG